MNDGWNVDRRRRHDAGRRRLVAPGREHHAVDEVALHQDLDEAEIGEIAVKRRGRPLSRFLNRMHRKFERQSSGCGDAVAHALGEFEMVAIAGREVRAGSGRCR